MPKRKSSIQIVGYVIKPQLHGKFKVVEYYNDTNRTGLRKRTVESNLDYSTAETLEYKLQQKLK